MLIDKNIIYYFYNYFGVLCISQNSKPFLKISFFCLFLNTFKFVCACGYKLAYELYLAKVFEIETFFSSYERTNFADVICLLEEFLYYITFILSFIIQNFSFRQIRKCLIAFNDCLNLNENYIRKYNFKCDILMTVILMYFVSTNLYFIYLLSERPYPAQILILPSTFMQGYFLFLYIFIKNYETKLIFNFVELRNSIEINFSKSSIKLANEKFSKIFNILRLFKATFEGQFSLHVGFFAASITFGVSF